MADKVLKLPPLNWMLPLAFAFPRSGTIAKPLAFDIPDGELCNVRFALNPMGLDIRFDSLNTQVLADVGGNCYDVRSIYLDRKSVV